MDRQTDTPSRAIPLRPKAAAPQCPPSGPFPILQSRSRRLFPQSPPALGRSRRGLAAGRGQSGHVCPDGDASGGSRPRPRAAPTAPPCPCHVPSVST
uniref:Uncharacterized protein n=1 Tax=Malurus cyaneus samueli TaxID=2593467 RepID=A0A8C5X250_9PASS